MTVTSWFTIAGVLLMVVGLSVLIWSISDCFTRQYEILGWVLMTLVGGFLTLGFLGDRGRRKGG